MSHDQYETLRQSPQGRILELPSLVPEKVGNNFGTITFKPAVNPVRAELANPPEIPPEDIEDPAAPPGARTSQRLEELKAQREANNKNLINSDAVDEYVRFDELHGSLNELISEIKGEPGTIGDYIAQRDRAAIGFVKDTFLGVGKLVYEGSKLVFDAQQAMLTPAGIQGQILDAQIMLEEIRLGNVTAGTMASGATNTATSIGKALVAPVTDPWAKGQYVEAVTRALIEIATLPFVALKSSKVAKGADALTDAATATKTAETASNASKAANASDTTIAPETAGPSGNGGKVEPNRSTKPTDKEIELAKSEGNSPTQIAARKKVAEDFYAEQGMPKHKIPSHTAGIDYSKPVDITTLPKGKYVNQYQVPNATQGSYYSEKGIPTTKLGIADSAQDRTTGIIVQKEANSYQVSSDVKVLRSTASKIEDTWSIPGETIKTDGGATQYFTMETTKFVRK